MSICRDVRKHNTYSKGIRFLWKGDKQCKDLYKIMLQSVNLSLTLYSSFSQSPIPFPPRSYSPPLTFFLPTNYIILPWVVIVIYWRLIEWKNADGIQYLWLRQTFVVRHAQHIDLWKSARFHYMIFLPACIGISDISSGWLRDR